MIDIQPSSTYRSMRSSLYPFIRNPLLQQDINSSDTNIQYSRRTIKKHLIQRYHDESYIIKEAQLTKAQKYAKLLNRITKKFLPTQVKSGFQNIELELINENLTIDPQSNILYTWNVLVALSIIYHIFQIPISLFFTERAYKSQFDSTLGITCNTVSLVILFINMVYVIPNTQYYHSGFLVAKHEKIINRYLGWRLAIDVISYLSLLVYVIAQTYALIYTKLLFYLMVYRLLKVDESLQKKVQLTKIRLATYKLLRHILLFLFLVLWISSIFFAIDYHYYLQGDSATYTGTQLWLTDTLAVNQIDIIQTYDDWSIWLNYSVYWCLQTVSMVGFGDITAKNPVQVILSSIVITCIVIFYAFFIAGVWEIVAEARQFSQYQNNQWKVYKFYQKQNMKPLDRKKQVSQKGIRYRQLKNKVGSYLFQMWNNQKLYSQINIVQILQKSLTTQLKDEVFINYRQNLFQRIDLFGQLARAETKSYQYVFRQLIFKITQKKYAGQQYIVKSGQTNKNLTYLVNGKLALQYPGSNYRRTFYHSFSDLKSKNIKNIPDQNYNFGVKQFFTQQKMPYSVICESFCKTLQLSYDNFIRSIKQIQQFYTKYCQLRDNLKYYKMDYLTGQQCVECGSNQHDLQSCLQCDISIDYKKHMKRFALYNKMQKKQNKDKCSKVIHKRKQYKSAKIINLSSNLVNQVHIDRIKSYPNYYPQHNF